MGLMLASWFVSTGEKTIGLQEFLTLRIKITNIIFFIVMISLWHIVFRAFDLYRSRRLENRTRECKDILKATTTGTVIFFICGTIFSVDIFTSNVYLIIWLSTTICTLVFRVSLRYFLKQIRLQDRNLRFIAIIGTNQRAYDIETWLDKHKEWGFCVTGYIDDVIYYPKEQIKILGKLSDFSNIIRNTVIDEVFVALPIKSHYEEIKKIISHSEEQGIKVRYLSQLFNTNNSKITISSFEEFPVLTTVNGTQENWQFFVKRTLDIILASALLILTFPLLLATAIAIKLNSPGSIFFIQDRVGYNKRIFRLYKFRTMVVDAEKLQKDLESLNEIDGPVFKIKSDPRITRVGKWLRKTSIDELPQLVNVFKGDMSLVGPRPLPVRDYNGFEEDWHRRRFSVRPGITCLWQVNGRCNIPFEKWMELDMHYIDYWSLLLDLKILVKTIPAIFRGSGAE
jgi:exopolysaccharide biosynthesis polyprenyl glycosylphosphotransferase